MAHSIYHRPARASGEVLSSDRLPEIHVANDTYGSLPWSRLINVPTSFDPSEHTHGAGDIDGLEDAIRDMIDGGGGECDCTPYDDTDIRALIAGKQDALEAGNNITIIDNVISAVDTVYDDSWIESRIMAAEAGAAAALLAAIELESNARVAGIAAHNESADAHEDIRALIAGKIGTLTGDALITVSGTGASRTITHVNNANTRHVTDTQISTWNAKFNTPNGSDLQYVRGDGSLAVLPTIPAAANNGTLTIQRNGATVATFGANSSTNVTANITAADPFWSGNNTGGNANSVTSVGAHSGQFTNAPSGTQYGALLTLPSDVSTQYRQQMFINESGTPTLHIRNSLSGAWTQVGGGGTAWTNPIGDANRPYGRTTAGEWRRSVDLTGDTMTGNLTVSRSIASNPSTIANAATAANNFLHLVNENGSRTFSTGIVGGTAGQLGGFCGAWLQSNGTGHGIALNPLGGAVSVGSNLRLDAGTSSATIRANTGTMSVIGGSTVEIKTASVTSPSSIELESSKAIINASDVVLIPAINGLRVGSGGESGTSVCVERGVIMFSNLGAGYGGNSIRLRRENNRLYLERFVVPSGIWSAMSWNTAGYFS